MKKSSGIGFKIATITIIAMSILTIVLTLMGARLYYKNVLANYIKYSKTILDLSYQVTDEFKFGDMITARDMPDEYEQMRMELNKIKNCADVKYLYAIYFDDIDDIHSAHYAINAKNQEELSTGEPLTDIYSYMGEPVEENAYTEPTLHILQDVLKSGTKDFNYIESDSPEYGHMVMTFRIIFNSQGDVAGLLFTEVDANKIVQDLYFYLRVVAGFAIIFTLIVIILYLSYARRNIIRPIEEISGSSSAFVMMMKEGASPEELVFDNVTVHSDDEISVLANDFELMAQGVIDYMKNLRNVTAEKERIGAELNVATQIQADMLPRIFPPFPDREEFDIYATMNPAKEVGGDFYDFFLLDDDHIGLVMADVSGKGVPAALFMVIAKTLIKNRALMGGGPAEVLSYANEQLCEGNDAELFVTVWFGIIQISTGKGIEANAGHEHPAIMRKDGGFELVVKRHSPPVATMEGMRFRENEFELHSGDTLFIYTDGVPEATDAHDELYGTERMINALNANKDLPMKDLLANVRADVDRFVGDAPQFDDLTMLGFHFN